MEPNPYPPCELEWSIAEREEFFASQDAITGSTNVAPFRPSPSTHNCGDYLTKSFPPIPEQENE